MIPCSKRGIVNCREEAADTVEQGTRKSGEREKEGGVIVGGERSRSRPLVKRERGSSNRERKGRTVKTCQKL